MCYTKTVRGYPERSTRSDALYRFIEAHLQSLHNQYANLPEPERQELIDHSMWWAYGTATIAWFHSMRNEKLNFQEIQQAFQKEYDKAIHLTSLPEQAVEMAIVALANSYTQDEIEKWRTHGKR